VTAGFSWEPSEPSHEIYIVLDPDGKLGGEITNFDNAASKTLVVEK